MRSKTQPTFVRHIDAVGYTNPSDEQPGQLDRHDLEEKLAKVIKAGNAIVNAQTLTERVIAIHDWKELIK